jgi:hypothetical protein
MKKRGSDIMTNESSDPTCEDPWIGTEYPTTWPKPHDVETGKMRTDWW